MLPNIILAVPSQLYHPLSSRSSSSSFSPSSSSSPSLQRRFGNVTRYHNFSLMSFVPLTFVIIWTGICLFVPLAHAEEGLVNLRCYTCNIPGFPGCDDPFLLENGKLSNCSTDRDDGRKEMCAKIYGQIVGFTTTSNSSEKETTVASDTSLEDLIYMQSLMNATTTSSIRDPFNESLTHSFAMNDSYFSRGCFPIGDGWVWRREPYNETFIWGDLIVSGSIYICRNTRCNSARSVMERTSSRSFSLIILLIPSLFLAKLLG